MTRAESEARRRNAESLRRWRASFAATPRARRAGERRAEAAVARQARLDERARFSAGHVHRCVGANCDESYACRNACDEREGDRALCPACFGRACEAEEQGNDTGMGRRKVAHGVKERKEGLIWPM